MKYAFKKMRRMRVYDKSNGEHKVTLNDFQTAQFTGSQDVVYADGADGAHLVGFDTAKVAGFNGTNGAIDSGYIAMQVGSDEIEVVGGTEIMIREKLTTADGSTVELTHKAYGEAGNEIGYIYAKNSAGNPGVSYIQGATASATEFAYDPSTRTITLPTKVFNANDTVFVDYYPKFKKYTRIDNDADKFSMTGRVIIDAWFTDLCSKTDVPLMVVMEDGKISGEIDLSFGDQAAVQNVAVEAMYNACGETKNLWKLYNYNMEEVDDN